MMTSLQTATSPKSESRTLTLTALALISLTMPLGLSGCTTAGPTAQGTPQQPILYGDERDSLNYIEGLYKKNPKDEMIAARYGKALREAAQYKDALSILLPLSNNTKVGTLANTELSAVYLSQAEFEKAEKAARKAISLDENNYRAWRNLGNSLDAQEKYPEGEEAFRKALDLWPGDDKVPVMNNLALNLAAQGYTDQALDMLYKAKKMEPDRVELERNIRIIRTLNEPPQYVGEKVPLPKNKPPKE